ncbi:unnamed protein product [Hermetia illucens]|uniref:Beta-1,4-glucuronyltransferase 1 n=2 Tax=Hermetia illucens TaxID=343691 RepID=A0A7R8UBG7_HERIL|nr:unnamed protein product [Hermetia illucens]
MIVAKCLAHPIRVVSTLCVLILTTYNVILTLRFLHLPGCRDSDQQIRLIPDLPKDTATIPKAPQITTPTCVYQQYQLSDDLTANGEKTAFSDIDFNTGRWDNQRLYKYFDFAIVGEKFSELSEQFAVCLATQSSLERLDSLVQVADHWTGPISVAVFAAGDDEFQLLQLYVTYLRKCFPAVRENVSFHLAFPKARLPTINRWAKHLFRSNICDRPDIVLKRLVRRRSSETEKWRIKNLYPQNHLRNLARKGCQSDNVFLTDVDIIPSYNFTENLDKFLRNVKCTKLCAYVIPTYEIDLRVRFPSSKDDLLRLVKKGLARPFHQKVFIYNQYATNFSRWQSDKSIPGKEDETHISHTVTNFEFLYEPFYVADDKVPPHDERFIGYGFTRNSQVYEMFVAGYTFKVLSPIFTCHWGLQVKKTRPDWREQQNNANRKKFDTFKREILVRYKKDQSKLFPKKTNKNV